MRNPFDVSARFAASALVVFPVVAFSFIGCGGEDTPALKEQSAVHGKEATKNMEGFMKNQPKDSGKKASGPQTK